jgi:hypothetical protein
MTHSVLSLRVLAFVPVLIALGSVALDLVFIDFFGVAFLAILSLLVFVGVGLLLVLRLPRQPVGWLFLAAGTLLQVTTAATAYSWAALVRAPGTLPLGVPALFIGLAWVPALGCLLLAIMLFPTGRLPSRRWGPAVLLMALATAIVMATELAQPEVLVAQSLSGQGGPVFTVPNPLVVDGILGLILRQMYGSPFLYIPYLIPVAAVATRFRTAAGNERQQLKWFAYASSVAMLFFVTAPVLFQYLAGLGPLIAILAMDLIPISVAIAILRYRLYDIDLLIKRTLVYGASTAAIAATFWIGILALQRILSPLTSGSELAIAASTLVSLALFQPVRRRVQDVVDRRFDRSRYNAARMVDAFADVLRDEVDLDEVRADLIGSVQQTMAPAHMSLWLRESRP